MIVALENAVPGPRSKLKTRMIPFLGSPLVSFQHKLCILQSAAGERSLFGFLARGQPEPESKEPEQAHSAFWHAENLFTESHWHLSSSSSTSSSPLACSLKALSTQVIRELESTT